MATVAVIDYGMGNLHSVAKALEHAAEGERVIVSSDASEIMKADRVVLPGVGAIRDCVAEIRRLGLDEVVYRVAETKPLLGVCVGMQALMSHSEENGGVRCLDVIPGEVRFFEDTLAAIPDTEGLKIPHMGWNQVKQVVDHPMWQKIEQESRFYFVHSYYVEPAGPDEIAAVTSYGFPFTSAVVKENVFAVQFHPEKSQHAGLQLYANFISWDGQS